MTASTADVVGGGGRGSPATPESGVYVDGVLWDVDDEAGSSLAELDELAEHELIPADWQISLDDCGLASIIDMASGDDDAWSASPDALPPPPPPPSRASVRADKLTPSVSVDQRRLRCPGDDVDAESFSSVVQPLKPADFGEYCTPEVSELLGSDWMESALII